MAMIKKIQVVFIQGNTSSASVIDGEAQKWTVNVSSNNLASKDFERLKKVTETMESLLNSEFSLDLVE